MMEHRISSTHYISLSNFIFDPHHLRAHTDTVNSSPGISSHCSRRRIVRVLIYDSVSWTFTNAIIPPIKCHWPLSLPKASNSSRNTLRTHLDPFRIGMFVHRKMSGHFKYHPMAAIRQDWFQQRRVLWKLYQFKNFDR